MGEIVFKSKYEVGDVVAFEKNNKGFIGIVEGYYIDTGEFWYNIRLNNRYVLTYSNGGDVGEESILFKLTDEQADLFKKYGCREINSYEFAIST